MDISFILFIDYEGQYIYKSLSCICNNFFNRCEVIIINNNCKEDKKIIIDNYQKQYKNIKIFDSNNEKTERQIINDTIKNCSGKYMMFFTDIDFIDSIGVEILKKEAQNSECDIIQGNLIGVDLATKKYDKINFKKDLYNKSKFIQNRLFKTEFLINNDIFINNEHTEKFMSLSLKADIVSSSNMYINVTCGYTLTTSSKYKYKFILNDNSINQLEKCSNSYSEVFNFIEKLNEEVKVQNNLKITSNYIQYLFKEGLNFFNIIEEKKDVLDILYMNLKNIDLKDVRVSENRKKLLSFIKNYDLDSYNRYKEIISNKNQLNANKSRFIRQSIYQKIYNIFTKFRNIRKRVLFIVNMPQVSGNFKYIKEQIDEYNKAQSFNEKITYKTIYLKTGIINKILYPYYIGMADYIVLAEHIPYISYLKKNRKTKVIQTWHAAGAFKKFGHSTSYMPGGPNPFTGSKMGLHSNYDIVTVSSKEVVKYYAEAFKMSEESVIPIGLPRADFFFNEEKQKKTKEKLYEKYEYLHDKKIILYAPTFRGSGKKRKKFDMKFNFNKFAENISDEYIILLKLHPSVKSCDIVISDNLKHKVHNLSDYNNINDLLIITDILIADYSSVIFEYSLLKKPIVFYAYDLEEYAADRDLYYKYEEFIPGPLAKNMEELITIINDNQYDLDKIERFSSKFFVEKDGNSSKRFVEQILLKNKN